MFLKGKDKLLSLSEQIKTYHLYGYKWISQQLNSSNVVKHCYVYKMNCQRLILHCLLCPMVRHFLLRKIRNLLTKASQPIMSNVIRFYKLNSLKNTLPTNKCRYVFFYFMKRRIIVYQKPCKKSDQRLLS